MTDYAVYKTPSDIPQLVRKKGDVALVTCVVPAPYMSPCGASQSRDYVVTFNQMNAYLPHSSRGQMNFTDNSAGPHGEAITGVVRFWLTTPEGATITECVSWGDVRSFFSGVRASNFEVVK